MNNRVRVEKLDLDGKAVVSYEGVVLERTNTRLVLEAFFPRGPIEKEYVTFRPGDRMVEYFFTDRYFNVFAVYNVGDEVFKGWYCNVTRPAEFVETSDGGLTVRAVDLALDYFLQPGGAEFILDEDEFAELTLTAEERQAAKAALAELQRMGREGELQRMT